MPKRRLRYLPATGEDERPVPFVLGGGWLWGILWGFLLGFWGLLPAAALSLWSLFRKQKWRLALLCAVSAVISCLYAAGSLPDWWREAPTVLPKGEVSGTVRDWVLPDTDTVVLEHIVYCGQPLEGRLELTIEQMPAHLQKGSSVTCTLSLRPAGREGTFGYSNLSKKIRFTGWVYACRCTPGETPTGIPAFRIRLTKAIDRDFSPSVARVVKALVLGVNSPGKGYYDLYRTLGLAHFLSVSGLHLTLLLVFIDLLSALLLHCRVEPGVFPLFLLGLLLVTAFIQLTDARLPVLRAALMWFILWLMRWMARPPDTATALLLTVDILSLYDPLSLLNPGLWLSLLAVLGITVGRSLPIYPRRRPYLRAALRSLTVGCAALLFMLPLLAAMFTTVQPLSPLLSAMFTLPMEAVLLGALLYTLGILCIPPLAALLTPTIEVLLRLTARCLAWLSKALSTLPLLLYRPFSAVAALCLVPVWSLHFTRHRPLVRLTAGILSAVLFVLAFLPTPVELTNNRMELIPLWNTTSVLLPGEEGCLLLTATAGGALIQAAQAAARGKPVTVVYLGEETAEAMALSREMEGRVQSGGVYSPSLPPTQSSMVVEKIPTDTEWQWGRYTLTFRSYSRSAGTKLYTVAVVAWGRHRMAYGELSRLLPEDTAFADCCLLVHCTTTEGRLQQAAGQTIPQLWNGGGNPDLAKTGSLLAEWGEEGLTFFARNQAHGG